jgi:hypothetical protein
MHVGHACGAGQVMPAEALLLRPSILVRAGACGEMG